MSKYICDKGHIFIHPAKITTGINQPQIVDLVETYHCPVPNCHTLVFSEYTEPVRKAIDQKDLDPSEPIKPYLDAGWEITAQYVKATRIVLYAPTPQQAEDKFTEDAKIYYKKLHLEGQP
jgi:hypothetical protein